ncbi:MAG: OmpA family protein [Campylobacterota bacterium]|nr:OmpA family protein [Campylobacterota bacterium]
MRKTYKNVLLSLCAISLLAGCASKDVEYEGSSSDATTQSSIDSKVDQISGSNEQSVDGSMTSSSNDMGTESVEYAKDRNRVDSEINGQTVTLDSIHFAFDKYNLTSQMRDVATSNATTITTVNNSYDNLKIKLEGNCDEWGTDEYNYALGLKRAKATKDALIADGIDANKIMLVSFGESNPVCTDKNVDCWKMNRRVDYRLLP